MSRDRIVAAALFAIAGVPSGLSIALSLGALSPSQIAVAALVGAVATGTAGAVAGRTLGTEARAGAPPSKGAVLGAFVSALGVLIGSVGWVAVMMVEEGAWRWEALEALVFVFVYVLVVALPSLAVGGLAGGVFYWLAQRGAVPV